MEAEPVAPPETLGRLRESLACSQEPQKLWKTLKKISSLPLVADALAEIGFTELVEHLRGHPFLVPFAKGLATQWNELAEVGPDLEPGQQQDPDVRPLFAQQDAEVPEGGDVTPPGPKGAWKIPCQGRASQTAEPEPMETRRALHELQKPVPCSWAKEGRDQIKRHPQEVGTALCNKPECCYQKAEAQEDGTLPGSRHHHMLLPHRKMAISRHTPLQGHLEGHSGAPGLVAGDKAAGARAEPPPRPAGRHKEGQHPGQPAKAICPNGAQRQVSRQESPPRFKHKSETRPQKEPGPRNPEQPGTCQGKRPRDRLAEVHPQSFEAALDFCLPPPKKKKKKKMKTSSESTPYTPPEKAPGREGVRPTAGPHGGPVVGDTAEPGKAPAGTLGWPDLLSSWPPVDPHSIPGSWCTSWGQALSSVASEPEAEASMAPTRMYPKTKVYSGPKPQSLPPEVSRRQQRCNQGLSGGQVKVEAALCKATERPVAGRRLLEGPKARGPREAVVEAHQAEDRCKMPCLKEAGMDKQQEPQPYRVTALPPQKSLEQRLQEVSNRIRCKQAQKPQPHQAKLLLFPAATKAAPLPMTQDNQKSTRGQVACSSLLPSGVSAGACRGSSSTSSSNSNSSSPCEAASAPAGPHSTSAVSRGGRKPAPKKVAPLMAKTLRDYRKAIYRK